jgi:hypothetical protein
LISYILVFGPAQCCDGFEFAHGERTACVAGFGARRGERLDNGRALGFIDCGCLEVAVEQHQQHGVSFLLSVYGTYALAGLAAGQQAASFNLQAASLPVFLLDCIIPGLPRRGEFDSEEPGGFVLGNLASDAEGLARECAVFLREFFLLRTGFA